MGQFQQTVNSRIAAHGLNISYIVLVEGGYNVETGTNTNTENTYVVKAYPKNAKATQYSNPNLIGKQIVEFLISQEELIVTPSNTDKIIYKGTAYTVDSYKEVTAEGSVVLLKVLAVKG